VLKHAHVDRNAAKLHHRRSLDELASQQRSR
jgi:hypothetical protein